MKVCKAEGCPKPTLARGWCRAHYRRWQRHGTPTGGRTSLGSLPAFITQAISHQGNDCLLWPYGKRHGYGATSENGRPAAVHVIVCKAVHGSKPSPKHEVAHSCGMSACINPGHLRWDTAKGNAKDKTIHGTNLSGERHGMAKLTAEQVQAIRARTGQTQHEIAREFGVTRPHISFIRNRKTWKNVI